MMNWSQRWVVQRGDDSAALERGAVPLRRMKRQLADVTMMLFAVLRFA